VIRLLGND
jgi:hypothetical protein